MKLMFLSLMFLLTGSQSQSAALYSNEFSGVAGTVASQSSPVHVIDDYYSASSTAAQLDGSGNLHSTDSTKASVNYRFRIDSDSEPADQFGAVKLIAEMRVPSSEWIGIGFHGENVNGLLSTAANAGPWVLISSGYARVFGGCGSNNGSDVISASGLYSAGDWIRVELTYYCQSETVSLKINDTLIADQEAVLHTDAVSGLLEAPSVQWVQVQFRYQDSSSNGGGVIDSLVVETIPGLLLPADCSETVSPHPQFFWEEGSFEYGADPITGYQIQIDNDDGFASPVLDDIIQINRYVPVNPLSSGDYWWRVRALRDSGAGNWSLIRKLAVNDPINTYNISSGASASAIASVLTTAKNNSPAVVDFEQATYRVSPASGAALLSLDGASDVIIDGNGSFIIIETPDAGFTSLKNCTDVTVRNFSVDYDPLPFTFGTVTAVDTTNQTFDLKLWDGYPRLDDAHMAAAQLADMGWGSLLNKNVPGRLKNNVNDFYRTEDTFTSLGQDTFRLSLTSAHASRISDFSVDDIFVKLARQKTLNYVFKSKNLSFYDVDAYASPGSYMAGSYCEGVNVLRGGSRIASGRWASGCADGVHCQNFRTGPWVEGCTFKGIMDDSANIYAIPMYVQQKQSDTEFRFFSSSTYDLRADDKLVFFDPLNGCSVGDAHIISSVSTNVSGTNYVDVVLDTAIGSVSSGQSKTNTTVYNVSRSGNQFVFRKNSYGDSRRYGLFIKSSEGLIVDNGFNCLSGPAITIHNNPGWPEGLVSSGISIISNRIINCSFSSYMLTQERGSIEMQLKGYNGTSEFVSSWRGHNGIHIQGNTILNWQRRAISGQCVEDLLIEDNIITNTMTGFTAGQSNYGIFLNNTDNAIVLNNQIVDTRTLTGAIEVQNSTNVIVYGNTVP